MGEVESEDIKQLKDAFLTLLVLLCWQTVVATEEMLEEDGEEEVEEEDDEIEQEEGDMFEDDSHWALVMAARAPP